MYPAPFIKRRLVKGSEELRTALAQIGEMTRVRTGKFVGHGSLCSVSGDEHTRLLNALHPSMRARIYNRRP